MSSLREALTELAQKWRERATEADGMSRGLGSNPRHRWYDGAQATLNEASGELEALLSLPDERERLEEVLKIIRDSETTTPYTRELCIAALAPKQQERLWSLTPKPVEEWAKAYQPKQERCPECGGTRCRNSALIGHIKGRCSCGLCPSCTGERA